ncbi:Potassium/sodium hyperpolarization-activated cyclic nucleotide-gated channel 4 [Acipenser ruthenus]|uniref:Potassium/sodium hyperpolarization-activated cyclic nucleotide-gated channel 4 n=1 Tax=Acipenser ruthenus TaxID=7906 RepID=A0A444ULU1_ACIRT|nr:Potassium/sodium hyperpolarization-activated cyclic nucleotide-gated channel 4 [Acipenser ruthenus]
MSERALKTQIITDLTISLLQLNTSANTTTFNLPACHFDAAVEAAVLTEENRDGTVALADNANASAVVALAANVALKNNADMQVDNNQAQQRQAGQRPIRPRIFKQRIYFLNMHDEELYGTVPSLHSCMALYLHSAELYGTVPSLCTAVWHCTFTLQSCMALYLHSAELYGTVPSLCRAVWHCTFTLQSCMALYLHSAELYGTVPSLCRAVWHCTFTLQSCMALYLHSAELYGTVPSLCRAVWHCTFTLQSCMALYLHSAELYGTVPSLCRAVWHCTFTLQSCMALYLHSAELYGTVPSLCRAVWHCTFTLQSCMALYLHSAELYGTVPSLCRAVWHCTFTLQSCMALYLHSAELYGTVPSLCRAVWHCTFTLQSCMALYLHSAELYGTVPSLCRAVWHCTFTLQSCMALYLHSAELYGTVPSLCRAVWHCTFTLQSCMALYLHSAELYGTVPSLCRAVWHCTFTLQSCMALYLHSAELRGMNCCPFDIINSMFKTERATQDGMLPHPRETETPSRSNDPPRSRTTDGVTVEVKEKKKARRNIFIPEVNKVTVTYFGSEAAVHREQERTENQKQFIIHPYGCFRGYWIVVMLVVTLINVLIIPLGVSFFSEVIHKDALWLAYNVISDSLFIVDLVLNFYTGFISDDKADIVLDLNKIRNHYFKSWFLPDLLAVLPVDYGLLIARDKSIGQQYSKAMFRALCHMMTLSYGTTGIPRGLCDIWVVIISMLIGAVMYALLLASLTSVLTNSEASRQVYDIKCNLCKEYMRCHRLPSDIRHRVMDYLESSYQGKWFEEDAILMELSESLRQDVIIYNCQRLVSNMPLFKDTDPNFITAMLDKLQFEMYQTNDVIIRNGALGNRMFFIDRGTVLVESANLMCQLRDGDFFGGQSQHPSGATPTLNQLLTAPSAMMRGYGTSYPDYNSPSTPLHHHQQQQQPPGLAVGMGRDVSSQYESATQGWALQQRTHPAMSPGNTMSRAQVNSVYLALFCSVLHKPLFGVLLPPV